MRATELKYADGNDHLYNKIESVYSTSGSRNMRENDVINIFEFKSFNYLSSYRCAVCGNIPHILLLVLMHCHLDKTIEFNIGHSEMLWG